ncbi:dihydropteroate synthase [Frigoriglobus tundricola]|uniref:Dihydropteroate synthase n=1 Tax=Frigoriglobus tundricola TaxID=2774151 RepID=A0A6M5Z3H4_9BACT|nr:dihydropteroate synthase [Frigoriglobus tundricola]QJX00265.1 Dihydropteroate synthase [Frigoriglobus tundricola]
MNPLVWHLRDRTLTIGPRPLVMGIVNVTPDSFSDGGKWFDHSTAVAHALALVEQGADVLDIGGESTRPNAEPVPLEEELRRVVPVVAEVARRTTVPISVDTMKAGVARACLEMGAAIINDVSGLRDPDMISVAQKLRAGVVVMHMRGDPQTMQQNPRYADVVTEVTNYLQERLRALGECGIPAEAACLDPGIGFGKTLAHNLELLANLDAIARLNRPVCLGVSRKGFIGKVCGRQEFDRDTGSLVVGCIAAARGTAHVLRVHAVPGTRDATALLEAIDQHRR